MKLKMMSEDIFDVVQARVCIWIKLDNLLQCCNLFQDGVISS